MKEKLNHPPDAPKKNLVKGTLVSAVNQLEQLFCYTFKRNESKNK